MGPAFYAFLFASGGAVGFLSGLLGIGGGIVLFPLLLYLTPALGFPAIGVKGITGLTMAQGFFASLSAMLLYRRYRFVHRGLVLTFGISLFASSLAGSVASGYMAEEPLLFVFGALALSAAAMMLAPRSYAEDDVTQEQVRFNRPATAAIGVALGFFLGMVGQGGAFIIIPVLLYVLKIPLRVALGSTLAIGLFSSTAGLAGKISTGQVPFAPAAALLAGAIPAARLGGFVGKRTNTRFLKWLLAVLISAAAVKIWADIF